MTDSTARSMSKSPVKVARMAFFSANQALSAYSSKFSRRDFTQAQLFSILVLKAFFKTDYRGVIEMLSDFKELQHLLKLKKIPHYSTLCYAEKRLLKKRLLTYSRTPYLEKLGNLAFFEEAA